MTDPVYEKALNEVRARVRASGSSFTAGMIALPAERRDAMFALYAFCREVDDIADEGATMQERLSGLQMWRDIIANLYQGATPENPIAVTLAPAIRGYALKEEDFLAIIDGMEMDARAPICAPSWLDLDLYCDRVASAVGRLSVHIFGDSSDSAMQVAYHLGRALQLTNILRDLSEDAARDRLYLPEELLSKHHITSRVPREVLNAACLIPACRDLAEKAQEHFDATNLALRFCDYKALRPAKIMKAYYEAILHRLIEEDWRTLGRRVTLSTPQKLWLFLRAWMD
jgi:phytoene synthase